MHARTLTHTPRHNIVGVLEEDNDEITQFSTCIPEFKVKNNYFCEVYVCKKTTVIIILLKLISQQSFPVIVLLDNCRGYYLKLG